MKEAIAVNNPYRKANGQFTRKAIEGMAEQLRAIVLAHKQREYTSPQHFGMWLMSRPRHKFKGGSKSTRFQKVFNFQ